MADEEQEENWPEFFENNRLIPVHPNRRKSGSQTKPNVPFCLLFKSVIGISLPAASDANSQEIEFQLRLTPYDAANKCFFGSTWLGPYFTSSGKENGRHKVVFDEAVYFYSSLYDITCVGVVEVSGEVNGQSVGCGWTLIRIFDRVSELTATTTRQPAPKSIPLYYGSPAGLLCISETIEDSPSLRPKEGCSLSFVLQIHPPLERVFHLIPENAVMSGDDFVPGILEPQPDGSGIVDILKKPRLAKTTPSFINKLSILLYPSVEEFEDDLRQMLNHDRLHKNNIIPDDGLQISIVERRLKVSVHNGWKFVSDPHIVYLEPEYEVGKSGRKSPASQSSVRGKILSLVLRSRLELKELVHHPLFAIIFELEYVMSEPFAQPLIETKRKKPSLSGSLMRSQNQTVTLRWAVWLPFEGGSRDERETTLELTGGCQDFPSNRLVYTRKPPLLSGKKAPKSGGKLKFLFTQQRRRESSVRSSTQGSQMLMVPTSPGLPSPGPFDTAGGMFSSVGMIIAEGGHPGMPLTPGVASRPPLPRGNRMSDEYPSVPPRDPLFQYGSPGMRPSAPSPVTHLSEVPHSTVHSPLILTGTGTTSASGPTTMTRAAYARLSSAGFPSIVDRRGNPPQVIDAKEELPLHLDTEGMDQLLGNEIIIQFLALSRCYNRTTFFSFQFYRFPQVTTERVYLKDTDSKSQGIPCVLQKFNKDGSLSDESPGLMLRYMVDPSYMQPGEGRVFSQYLLSQALHIDVWDGDSLLLIGSTTLPLKHILRQGREAVIVAHELDVVFSEISEEAPTQAGDMTRTGTIRPFGIKSAVEARLHLRVANIGHPSEPLKGKLGTVPKKHSTVVVSETVRETGTTNGLTGNQVRTKLKAKQMAECDAELAAVLFSRQDKIAKDDQPVREADAIRKRKLERMLAIRQIQGADNSTGNLIIQKEEKLQRTRDLKTIQLYREKLRHEKILSSLAGNITTSHTIYPSFGTAEFFEFVLRNPYSTEQTITVHCDDNELQVITDTREWRHFKRKTETRSALEENMFDTASTSPYPQVFLRPRETVHIPFKFQTFRADQSVPEQGPSHPLKQQTQTYLKMSTLEENNLKPRQIKVSFMNKDECPVAILTVQVEPRPHVVDRTFRFYHAEQSFLKKIIRLPPWRSLPGAPVMDENTQPQVHVRCSDVNAVCEARKMPSGEPQDVFLKIACGPSPSVKRFFVLLYIDPFLAEPCQTWQLYVHSLQRIDMSAVQGQSSRLSVILRGTKSSRLVQCFSSHPEELQVSPTDPIMLMANAVQEVHLTLRPHTSGSTRYMYVNVVDVEFHQLVRTWLVCASCQMPVISKSFELQIQVGGGKGSNKRVSFANPYPTKKTFHLKCNRPDLLQFKESIIEVGPGQSHSIGLRFTPQQFPGKAEIFIFINDSEDKNEETFSINAVYT